MKINVICIISGYPSLKRPAAEAFVKEIAHGFARAGKQVVVVCPVPFPMCRDREGYPYCEVEGEYPSNGKVIVYRPATLSFGGHFQHAWLGPFNPPRVAAKIRELVVLRTLARHHVVPDAFYGHFIEYGIIAARVAWHFGKPSFCGVGESGFDRCETVGMGYYRHGVKLVTAFIPNATHFVPVLEEKFGIPRVKMHVLPNGINLDLFKPGDKVTARKKYGIPSEAFVVGSTGHFIHRKGINRVAEAIRDLEGVYGIFAGKGPLPPKGPRVLFKQPIAHGDLPEFLSACDVFVLPTLSEGCCNAIAEAMACGLPIISSTNKYVDDQLDDSCSLRVNPLNVEELRSAILKLKENPDLCRGLAEGAIIRSKLFDLKVRISKILSVFDGDRNKACD